MIKPVVEPVVEAASQPLDSPQAANDDKADADNSKEGSGPV